MTRKDFVQSQIDFYNSVLGSVVLGGLIGLIILIVQFFQSLTPVNGLLFFCMVATALVGMGVVGCVVNFYRNKFLNELSDMP